jgi:hypothetical protein
MSDSDESSIADDYAESTQTPSENENDSASIATTSDNSLLQQNVSLTDMAAALLEDNNITFNLSTEEEALIKDFTVNTKNMKKVSGALKNDSLKA